MLDFSSVEIERRSIERAERVSREIDLDLLDVEISHNAEQIARALFGEPNRSLSDSQCLKFGSKGSVAVPIGDKSGVYYDHEAGSGGGLLSGVKNVLGLDFLEAVQFVVQDCGVSQNIYKNGAAPDDLIAREISKEAFAERRAKAAKAAALARAQKTSNARVDWDSGVALSGTPAAVYLASRGLDPDTCGGRFDTKDRSLMVAFGSGAAFKGVQKTYLLADGSRAKTIRAQKRAFGDLRGSSVRLPGQEPSNTLVLAEGFETALSVHQATHFEVWACLGPHFADAVLGASELPSQRHIIIAADNDAPQSAASQRVSEDVLRLTDAGFTVTVVRPTRYQWQKTGDKTDWNDVLQREGTETLHKAFYPAPSSPDTPDPMALSAHWIEDFASDMSPAPSPYISRLIYPRSFTMVAGPPKSMKSLWVQHLLVAAASGEAFFGFEVYRPLKIFYINAEMDHYVFRSRIHDMNLSVPQLEKLAKNMLVTDRFKMRLDHEGGPALVALAKEYFTHGPPDIIVLDPLANIFSGDDENNNVEMMKFLTGDLEALRELINPDAALVVVHHSAKSLSRDRAAGGGADPFNAIRGAGALRGYYDTGIVIERVSPEDNLRRISFETRRSEAPPMQFMRFHDGAFTDVPAPEGPGKANTVQKETAAQGKYLKVLDLILGSALEGQFSSANAFAEKHAQTHALGSATTLRGMIGEMLAKDMLRHVTPSEIEEMTQDFESYRGVRATTELLVPIEAFLVRPIKGPYQGEKITISKSIDD
ncbi:MAG: AAA family ATPase [Rhodobacteraceae bacterium]|nr:AAA family ATPase [Paracoccaceae bacterium]